MTDGCMMCGGEVEFPDFTALCNSCEDAELDYANRPLPCCGHSMDYCECSPWVRDFALINAAAELERTPFPRSEDDPPF